MAPAHMTPGRSLLPNINGCSIAPVANTTLRALTFQNVSTAPAVPAADLSWMVSHIVIVVADSGGFEHQPEVL